jgi:hypothetical protein
MMNLPSNFAFNINLRRYTKGVIRRLLCSDAGERVTATELLDNRWVGPTLNPRPKPS